MRNLGIYQLTHPESMTDAELLEILENSCIDQNTYKNLSRLELIELYKKVAMPLPRRRENKDENVTKPKDEQNLTSKLLGNSMDCISNSKEDISEINEIPQSLDPEEQISLLNKIKETDEKICLHNPDNVVKSNGIIKRVNEKHSDAPLKKRQKITWP